MQPPESPLGSAAGSFPVSVLVCTKDRPASLERAVRSLLDSDVRFELLVIDQSDPGDQSDRGNRTDQGDTATARSVLERLRDPRVRYIHTSLVGKGAALNHGLELASGDILVCTDDDCEAPRNWVASMAAVLAERPSAAVVFCNVIDAGDRRPGGYVPTFSRDTDKTITSIRGAAVGLGLGAGMALRRRAIAELGGFDPMFGPGSRFPSGDDWDIALRVLLCGWHVHETASLSIRHHGFRTFAEGRDHALRDWLAIGALCAKPVRVRPVQGGILVARLVLRQALWPPAADLLRLRRPRGFARIRGFAAGFVAALSRSLDRDTLKFS